MFYQSSSFINNSYSHILAWFYFKWRLLTLAAGCKWNEVNKTLAMVTLSALIVYLSFKCILSSHFRGATIGWKPSDKEGEVSVKLQNF